MAGLVALVTVAVILAAVLAGDRGAADRAPSTSASPPPAESPSPGPATSPPAPSDPVPPTIPGEGTGLPEATLQVAGDGCGVIRSDFPNGEPDGLQWSITDQEGFVVLARNAAGEDRYRYYRPGRYEVVLEAFGEDSYEAISNRVPIEC
ncbi:MAG TPA: hypothetical protein VGW11_12645 [Solirubrobacteraceae bacterium]|nr:hypothetical protein [Solirubrobacteraceae bacterium]